MKVILLTGASSGIGYQTADELAKQGHKVYGATAKKAANGMRKHYSSNMLSKPKVISNAISKDVNKRKPKTRYLVGFGAKPLVFMHTILPDRVFDFFMKNASLIFLKNFRT